jgi:hypothetical protein
LKTKKKFIALENQSNGMAKINNRLEEIKYWNEKKKNSKPLKKTPIKKKSYKLKRQEKPIAKKSKKQSSRDVKYLKARLEFLSIPENKVCNIVIPHECTIIASDVHHKKGKVGELYFDKKYFRSACRNGHNAAHDYPEQAYKTGDSVLRLKKD